MSFELSTVVRGVWERILEVFFVTWSSLIVRFVNDSMNSWVVADRFSGCNLSTTSKTGVNNPSYLAHFDASAYGLESGILFN